MRQWQPFKNYFKEFIEIWNYWFISEPSQCPLSSGQYVDHMGIFSNSIDDLLEFDQGEDLEAQFCTQLALFYLSDATGKDGRLHLERILGIDERRAFVFLVIYAIKRGSEEEKESCLTYIENQLMNEEIPMDIAERIASIHPVVIKIIFNQGLQNENIRLLQIASTYYELKTEMETEVELSLYYLNYLFFCALALQQIDKALEIARILEERTTGSGRVHLGLCDLAKGKPLTPNQVEDFNRSIQERQRSIADPHILRFISAQMLKGPGPGSILNVLSARFEKFARTFIHPWS